MNEKDQAKEAARELEEFLGDDRVQQENLRCITRYNGSLRQKIQIQQSELDELRKAKERATSLDSRVQQLEEQVGRLERELTQAKAKAKTVQPAAAAPVDFQTRLLRLADELKLTRPSKQVLKERRKAMRQAAEHYAPSITTKLR